MYPTCMTKLFLYFDLWGFSTQFRSKHQKFYRIIFIVHIVSAMVTTIVTIRFLNRPNNDKLGSVNDTIKMISIVLVYWLSILELHSKQESQRKFWEIVQNIDEHFCCHQHFRINTYILKLMVYVALVLAMYLNYLKRIIVANKRELFHFEFWYTFIGLFRINQLFYYLFFLEFIKNELKMINHEANEMMCDSKNGNLKNANNFLYKFQQHRLKWFRKFYGSIYDLCTIINAVFGWSNLAAIIISFQLILTDFNWFYWKIFNQFHVDVIGKTTLNTITLCSKSFLSKTCLISSLTEYALLFAIAPTIFFVFQASSQCFKLVSLLVFFPNVLIFITKYYSIQCLILCIFSSKYC